MELRNYQKDAIDAVYDYLRCQNGNPCVVIPTGGGKTPLLATICSDVVTRWQGRVLVLAHVKELLQQAADKLQQICPDVNVGVYSAGLNSRDTEAPVIVAGIQSVYKRACELDRFDLIIVDECFPEGTLIDTPRGAMPIEDIYVGQSIFTASGASTVEAISARMTPNLVQINLSNGKNIRCTPNHPFFTENGWTCAGELARGTHVFSRQDMQMLRESVSSLDEFPSGRNVEVLPEGKTVGQAEVLLNLLFENAGKSHVRQTELGENDEITKQATNQNQGRQRSDNGVTTNVTSMLERWLENGIGDSYNRRTEMRRSPKSLQSRFGISGTKMGNRTRRSIPSNIESSSCRQDENTPLIGTRVESVETLELASPVAVYNLQIKDHPSYYAEGILVHNCHLLPPDGEGMYQTFLRDAKIVNPHVRLIGLTATPYRMKSGNLVGPDNLLNHICYEIGVKELIEQGFLCPLRSKSGRHKVDCSDLHIRAGEFIQSEVDELMNTTDHVDAAVREIVTQTKERNSVLVFGVSVDHAKRIQETIMRLTSQECGLVTGDTPAMDRERILRRFKGETFAKDLFGSETGPLKYLVNVNVLTTGFDAPNVDCVVLLRPTASPGLYYQCCGRGFRLHESKIDCLVLDYGGNILRHGPIDAIQVIGKDGNGNGNVPAKECPVCLALIHAAIRFCPECGYEFPEPEKETHDETASSEGILTGEITDTEYDVEEVFYHVHTKRGATENDPKTLRIDYRVGFNQYQSEWVCPEHTGWARKKFEKWWSDRSRDPPPDDAAQAVRYAEAGSLSVPLNIIVRKVGGEKFARIVKSTLPPEKPDAVGELQDDTTICIGCEHCIFEDDFSISCKLYLDNTGAVFECQQFSPVQDEDIPF